MTMPNERAKALIWAGEFLREIEASDIAPTVLKKRARHIMRHYPEAGEIMLAARLSSKDALGAWLAPVEKLGDWH